MAKVIAITGGRGFIGRHLVARCVSLGYEVRYLTRKRDTSPLAGATPFFGDLVCPDRNIGRFVHGVDVLFHCAAELLDPSRMEETNVSGTRNLLKVARDEVRHWVQLSSTGVYGVQRGGLVTESTDLRPSSAYELSKAAADGLVLEASVRTGLSCLLLRPSNVYAPDMSNQSLFQLIRMIEKGLFFFIGPSGAIANYVHVEDVVDALLICGQVPPSRNGREYIVSDNCTLETFVATIAVHLGRRAPRLRLPLILAHVAAGLFAKARSFPLTASRVAALTDRTLYSTDRISNELGFRNRITIEQGLGEMTEAWRRGTL